MKNLITIHEERKAEFDKDSAHWFDHEDQYDLNRDECIAHNKETTLALLEGMIKWLEGGKKKMLTKGSEPDSVFYWNKALDTTISYIRAEIKKINAK